MVKIRLKRMGKKRKPFYHVVVADARTARDGTYDPMTTPSTINIDLEKVTTWIKNGAKPTETAKKLIDIAEKAGK